MFSNNATIIPKDELTLLFKNFITNSIYTVMMKVKFMLLIALFTLTSLGLQAQKVLTGTVKTADGQPISGCTVAIKGTTSGTITGADGKFNLRLPENVNGDSLSFSFIGMENVIVPLGDKTVFDVTMSEKTEQVDEVVVTAMGISKARKALGYSTAQISGSEIADSKVVNPMSALQGKVSGVDIAASSGPGSTQNVMIRGAASFSNNQPLYVIDGVPLINNQTEGGDPSKSSDHLNFRNDFGSGINAINPDDIASMSVLKGSAATALYGSRAANGVVLITTKSGKNTDGKMQISYDGSLNIEKVGYIFDRQDEYGQGWNNQYSTKENGNWGPEYTGLPHTWGNEVNNTQKVADYKFLESRYRDFFEYGLGFKNAVSLSGGNDKTNYFFSLSDSQNNGVYPGDYDTYNRLTIASRGSHTWNKLTISSSVNFANEKTKSVPTGQGYSAWRSVLETAENISLVDLEDQSDIFNSPDYYFTPYGINPYYSLRINTSEFHKYKTYGKVQADYSLFKDLKLTYRFGFDVENSKYESILSKISYTAGSPNSTSEAARDGSYIITKRTDYEINNDVLLNYNKTINDKFSVDALVGINIMEKAYNWTSGNNTALDVDGFYNLDNSLATSKASQSTWKKRMIGIFANVDLDYDRTYYLTLTARNDFSSTLPADNNSYFYPGATFSWIFTQLGTDGKLGPLTFGKLRAAYGWTGQDADPYYVFSTYTNAAVANYGYSNIGNFTFPINGVNSWQVSNIMGNSDLKPELTNEYEFGLELDFYNGRFGFDGDYYNKYTKDLIAEMDLDRSTGYASTYANIGDVRNKGYELSVYGYPVKNNDFKWKLTGNFSQNFNTVEKLKSDEVYLSGYSGMAIYAVEGEAIGQFKGTAVQTVELDGTQYTVCDKDGLPASSVDAGYYNKDVNEKFRAGLTTRFDYKNFSLEATLDLHYGGYMYCYTKDYLGWTGAGYETTYNDRNPFIVPGSVQTCDDAADAKWSVPQLDSDGNFVYDDNGVQQFTYYKENTSPIDATKQADFYSNGSFNREEDCVIDRSYLKLRNITLSYTMPSNIVNRIKLKDVVFSVTVSNLLLWTPVDNCYIDPEVTTFGNSIDAKFGEFGATPQNQVYVFGVSVKF